MNAKEFSDFLLIARSELMEAWKAAPPDDKDVYVKVILDYQERVAKGLFNNFNALRELLVNQHAGMLNQNAAFVGEIKNSINDSRLSINKDNRERLEVIMEKLYKIQPKEQEPKPNRGS